MVLLTGPRQTGKSTIAQSLASGADHYLSWDVAHGREQILKREWPREPGILALDEIHKYSRWRDLLKDLYDDIKLDFSVLVTGSAKLGFYPHGGDSLQGRYFLHRLHPLSVSELGVTDQAGLIELLSLSGFPEPFFSGSQQEQRRWSRQYRSLLVQEEIRDLEQVTKLGQIEQLALRLPELVASPLSLNSLREDIQVSHQTVANWCDILERLFYIFRVYPFGAPSIRAIKKTAKHYHFDWSLVHQEGAKFENFIGCHLLKWIHHLQDIEGREVELRYFRDTEKREVDFVVIENNNPILAVEVKASAKGIDPSLLYFKAKFPAVRAIQVELNNTKTYVNQEGIEVLSALDLLQELV